jgi:hypothetical protein
MEVDGGRLEVDWREDGVWMTGPVARVFDGVLSPDLWRRTMARWHERARLRHAGLPSERL